MHAFEPSRVGGAVCVVLRADEGDGTMICGYPASHPVHAVEWSRAHGIELAPWQIEVLNAHTPAEARTGVSDTMAAIGAEVATLRELAILSAQYGIPKCVEALDRIAAWAPERATDPYADIPLWLHRCGHVRPSREVPELCYSCRESGNWRALYVQAGR